MVIGGGAMGTSITYRLAKAGVGVVLVDKKGVASGCTGTSVALVNASSKSPDYYTELSMESARMYRSLAQELEEEIDFEGRGNMPIVVESPDGLAAAQWLVDQQNKVPGMRMELLGPEDARTLEPSLAPHIAGAVYCSLDGCVNNLNLAMGQARAAQRAGAKIQTYTRVTDLRLERGRIKGVVTDKGTVEADVVICAAGIHTPAIGEMAGVTIPVVASRGQMVTTEVLPRTVGIPVGSLRQTAWGSVLIGGTDEFVGYSRDTDYEPVARNTARALRLFPDLRRARAIRFWAGLRPWPVDGLPVLGPVPEVAGLYVAATHSGITLAPVVGRLMAELVTTGRTSIPIEQYGISRFTHYRRHAVPMDGFHRFWAEHRDSIWMV